MTNNLQIWTVTVIISTVFNGVVCSPESGGLTGRVFSHPSNILPTTGAGEYQGDWGNGNTTNNTHPIHVAFVLKLLADKQFRSSFREKTEKFLESLLSTSQGSPLHFIVITDDRTLTVASGLVTRTIRRFIVFNILRLDMWKKKKRIPKITISYVQVKDIVATKPEFVKAMMDLMPSRRTIRKKTYEKYRDDIFFLGPLYHLAFTNLDKIVVFDTDLEFYEGVEEVWREFDSFPQTASIGATLDLSPHYYGQLHKYRKANPDTKLGLPGRFQGFNAGVQMYHMEKMRNTQVFKQLVNPETMQLLLEKYGITGQLAVQDYTTVLGFEYPELFHVLPCQFNVQFDMTYKFMENSQSIFEDYRNCSKPWKVFHKNGCGPTEESCKWIRP